MARPTIKDTADRYALANELHARPFSELTAPCYAVSFAVRQMAGPDAVRDRADLVRLLDRFGAAHPPDGASHHTSKLGAMTLKWERHTEFVTYTLFVDGRAPAPFSPVDPVLPAEWLESLAVERITAAIVEIDVAPAEADLNELIQTQVAPHFVAESLAVASVLDGAAIVASDFRIDPNGFVRFAVLARQDIGPRRLGRITQRLFEIENYKTMAMATLPVARAVSARLSELEPALTRAVQSVRDPGQSADDSLDALLAISTELEELSAAHAYRFSAAAAYGAIVGQRIDVLREERVAGRQTLAEFMMRRFDPAMRTCASSADRLAAMATRTARAGDMLRTRTDVDRAAQNQRILERMDERAAQQLQLQKTVEGLSVVAVSYYAVSLASYAFAPFAGTLGLSKPGLTALLTVPIVLAVWMMIRRIRNHF